jgi:hypothetical protein
MGGWVLPDGRELDKAKLYRRWQEGRCPCCGGSLERFWGYEPRVLAEGVQICGRCAALAHVKRPGEREALLHALAAMANGNGRH